MKKHKKSEIYKVQKINRKNLFKFNCYKYKNVQLKCKNEKVSIKKSVKY